MRRLAGLAVAVLVLGLFPSTADTASGSGTRAKWDTRVFASVPKPGFPAYVYVHPNGRVYAGTYTNPAGDTMRSRVFEWTASGTLLRSWTVPGQNLKAERGVQVATSDARGRLVLLEKSTRSVLTLNVRTGVFKRQAQLPAKSIPNYATWGPGGALFVSDYGRGLIWRIPARGGTPRIWFASKALDGFGFGTTGLVYLPGRHAFLIGQQTTADPLSNPASGKLYRLGVRTDGRPGALRTLWTSRIGELPDGFGVARSGHVYIANVGLSAQLVEVAADGRELARFPKTPLLGDNGSPVPFDGPSNATFLGTRVLVANQSPITGDPAHHVILDVEVGEAGAARYLPANATLS